MHCTFNKIQYVALVLVLFAVACVGCASPKKTSFPGPVLKISKDSPLQYSWVGTWEDGVMVPKTEADRLWCQAMAAECANDKKKTKELFEAALKAADANGEKKTIRLTLQSLTNQYIQDKEWDKAEPLLLRSVEIHEHGSEPKPPTISEGYPLELAMVYDATGRSKEAEEYLLKVVNAERRQAHEFPEPVNQALSTLGDYYMTHKRWREGADTLKDRLTYVKYWDRVFSKDDVEALHKYAVCLRLTGNAKSAVTPLQSAIEPLEKCYSGSLSPFDSVSRPDPQKYKSALVLLDTDLGDCLQDLNDYPAAEAAYARALKMDPTFNAAITGKSNLQKKNGRG